MRSASCCILLLRVHCRPLQVVLIIHSASLKWAGVLSKPQRAQNYRGNVEKWHEMARWTGDPRSMIITRHNKQNKGWQKTNMSSNRIALKIFKDCTHIAWNHRVAVGAWHPRLQVLSAQALLLERKHQTGTWTAVALHRPLTSKQTAFTHTHRLFMTFLDQGVKCSHDSKILKVYLFPIWTCIIMYIYRLDVLTPPSPSQLEDLERSNQAQLATSTT